MDTSQLSKQIKTFKDVFNGVKAYNIYENLKFLLDNKYEVTSEDLEYYINSNIGYKDIVFGLIKVYRGFSEEEYINLIKSSHIPFIIEPLTQKIFDEIIKSPYNIKHLLEIDLTKFTCSVDQLDKLIMITENHYFHIVEKIIKTYNIKPTIKSINYLSQKDIYIVKNRLCFLSSFGLKPDTIKIELKKYINFKGIDVSHYKKYTGPTLQYDQTKMITRTDKNKHIFDLLKINNQEILFHINDLFMAWCKINLVCFNSYIYFNEESSVLLKHAELKETFVSVMSLINVITYILLNTIIIDDYTVFKIPKISSDFDKKFINDEKDKLLKYVTDNNLLIKNKIYFDDFLTNKYQIEPNKYISKANIGNFIYFILNRNKK